MARLRYLFNTCKASKVQAAVTFVAMADLFFFDDFLILGLSFYIDLSALDACYLIHYSCRLLIFRYASPAQRDAQLDALKTG